uniref:Uncharacterized protein n=1 Tax=Anguilla anguilla TaxID=7936 RepID=A0A0E9V1A2_ANGAN
MTYFHWQVSVSVNVVSHGAVPLPLHHSRAFQR